MADLKKHSIDFESIAVALLNLRAILSIIIPVVVLVPLALVLSQATPNVPLYVVPLTAVVALLVGWSAAGGHLMDLAQGLERRSVKDGLIRGLQDAFFILLALLFAVIVFLLWGLIVAAVFYVCKLPLLGPVVFLIAAPVVAIVSGAMLVCMVLASILVPPGLWQTGSIVQAVARFYLMVMNQLPYTLKQVGKLLLITAVLAALFGAVVQAGSLVTSTVSAPILGAGLGVANLFLAAFTQGEASSYTTAGMVGSVALAFLAMIGPVAVSLLGANTLYLDLSEGLDMSRFKSKWNEGWRRAADTASKVQAQLNSVVSTAQIRAKELTSQKPTSEEGGTTMYCPGCNAAIAPGHAFCGNCGRRLKD